MGENRSIRQLVAAARPTPVWLDYYDYAERIIGKGDIPWLDQIEFATFVGKAQSLLKSAVINLPVEPLACALLARNPALRAAMAAKSRSGFPLRKLMEAAELRAAVNALLTPLRTMFPDTPLALVLPSPRAWLATAYLLAHDAPLAAEAANNGDEIDGAAVHIADFCRSFSTAGIDALVLAEDTPCPQGVNGVLALYEPVMNTAAHYRWDFVLKTQEEVATADPRVAFYIAPKLATGVPGAINQLVEIGHGCHFWRIPVEMQPEAVLSLLTRLRS